MLVLARKPGEAIVIDGQIHIRVIEIKNGQVRLGIDAPRSHRVYRQEVLDQIQAENQAAASLDLDALAQWLPGGAPTKSS
jgi:carbon storage regulator